jgi:hypothetical protein
LSMADASNPRLSARDLGCSRQGRRTSISI